jgi:hypothetical protein
MRSFSIGFLFDFCCLFVFVFSLGCVYLCFHLPCTFNGWVPILGFDLQIFLLYVVANSLIFLQLLELII